LIQNSAERIWRQQQQQTVNRQRSHSVVKREGWLSLKKGNKLIQKYKECWFELDELNEYMTYYSDEKSLGNLKCKQLGTISLEGAKMEKDEKNACKFNVKTKAGKVYSLQTSTTEERNEWIAAMNKVRDFAQTASQLLQEWEKDQECHNCIQDLAPIVEKDEMMASSEDDDKQAGMLHVCIPIRAI
jgi:hypothetical protein